MSRHLRSFAKCRTGSLRAIVFASIVLAVTAPALADAAADAIINKGIKALGGEARLVKARATTSKVKISDDNGVSKIEHTTDGLDRMRSTLEGDFGGNKFTAITVLDGEKCWRKVDEMEVVELEGDELADEKWRHLSGLVPLTLVTLKRKDLKLKAEVAGDEKVGGKPAAGVKVTGPEGRDFTIYFDAKTGLPVKVVADGPDPESPRGKFTQETYYSDYRDFGGVKRAKKVEIKHDGQTVFKMELVDFKVLDKVDDKTFAKPE